MSAEEKKVLFVSAAIGIGLLLLLFAILAKRTISWKNEGFWRILLLALLFIPLGCVGIFFLYYMFFAFATMVWEDEIISLQIFTNIPTAFFVYMLFKTMKEKE